jgi:hypothetical protein
MPSPVAITLTVSFTFKCTATITGSIRSTITSTATYPVASEYLTDHQRAASFT